MLKNYAHSTSYSNIDLSKMVFIKLIVNLKVEKQQNYPHYLSKLDQLIIFGKNLFLM